jgi:hypothetical protein
MLSSGRDRFVLSKICQILTNKKMTTQQKNRLCTARFKTLNSHYKLYTARFKNFTLRIYKLSTIYDIQTFVLPGSNFKLSHYKLCPARFKTLHYKLYTSRYKTLKYDIINFMLLCSKLYTQDS